MRALVVCCLVVAVLAGVPLTSAQSTPTEESRETTLIVALEDDGDARWTVETRLPLSGPNETQGFRELGTRYVDGEVQSATAPETFRRIATQVGEETGRQMAIENASRSWRIVNDTSEVPGTTAEATVTETTTVDTTPAETTATETALNRTGVLSFSFTWTNFARTEENQVVVGDAFQTSDRWLPGLRAGQTLILRAPENHSITSASVGHTRETVRWKGPTSFDGSALQATFTSTNGTRTSPAGPADPELPISLEGLLAIVAAILLAGVAYGVARRSARSGETVDGESTTTETTSQQPSTADETRAAGTSEDPFAGVDEDLLSDEERIERHLEAAGGRMKQAEIVDRTGWSNAKVSQVLSQMDEDGRVEKLRIGRENLISLPDGDE
jgi:uncharacterized membrane protein